MDCFPDLSVIWLEILRRIERRGTEAKKGELHLRAFITIK